MKHDPENLLDLLGEDAPSVRMRAQLEHEITAEKNRLARRPVRRRPLWATAAVLAVAVVMGAALWPTGGPDQAASVLAELAADSALRRAQGARRSLDEAELTVEIRQRLTTMLHREPDPNVRLAVMQALAARNTDPTVRDALLAAVAAEDSPLLQARLVLALRRGPGELSPAEIERLQAIPELDEAARTRLPRS